jgi:membrane protein YqaA with SNARE-associated domain
MKEKLTKLFQTKKFKKITLILGILFTILTFAISLDPRPFLKFGYLGVFVFNLFGPGTYLIPSLSRHMNLILLAAVSACGMTLNDSIGWLTGKSSDVVIRKSEKIKAIKNEIHKYGPVAIFFWSIIPMPIDLIPALAGYLEFPYRVFFIPNLLGKFLRFILVGLGTTTVLKLIS